jgi:Na+/melibiose symporter-like transporter
MFFAVNSFVQKAVSGIGIFVSTLVLRAIDFPADAKPGAVDPEVIRSLGVVYVPLLGVLIVIVIGFLRAYRITRAGHEANLRRLAERRAEVAAAEAK